jgi:hypothetical protein
VVGPYEQGSVRSVALCSLFSRAEGLLNNSAAESSIDCSHRL